MGHLWFLIGHYGYWGIVIALIGGIVGLPLPDEVLLTFVGYNVYLGNMAYLPSILCAFAGACIGITLSYLLGLKLGLPFLKRFGPKLHITEDRIEQTKKLFEKMGPLLLFIGYFIPGVRHVTAYLSGINGYSYKKFFLYAYSGAFTWCFTFITVGKTLGENWRFVEFYLSRYSIYLFLLLLIGSYITYVYWKKRRFIKMLDE
ncbi:MULTISPECIES: DedA family protein [Bacillaceae]|uniref:DedA family protein n=1 Tax=Bacillaceae TaxID=186817 RepID=UPI002FFEE3D7